jgi:prepilin-type N-terminal cleavage/methylation domain-containing protein
MRNSFQNNFSGFTLLEIMLALSILALLSLGIAAGLSAGVKAWESGEKNLESFQQKRIVCERLIREISCAIKLNGKLKNEEEAKLIFNGESDSLSFITTASAMFSPGIPLSLKETQIYVDPGEGLIIKESMFSRDDFFNHDKGNRYVLDPTVRDIEFQYFYIPNPKSVTDEADIEGEWLTSWGPEHITIQENIEEADDGTKVRDRVIRKQLPVAVEIDISSEHPNSGGVEHWPSLIIPLQEARVLGVSFKRMKS